MIEIISVGLTDIIANNTKMDKTQKNVLFIGGISCQLLGLFCFLTFWLMYFAIAFFIIGTILILLSRKKWYLKLLSLSPMFFVSGMIINVLYFEKYIIPNDFSGVVYIITDPKSGKKKEYDFFSRVYRIPKSGVLFTKFDQNSGINNRSFYQVDKEGNLKKLGILDYRSYIEKGDVNPPKTEPSRDSLAVFTPEIQLDFESTKNNTVFTVGRYKNIKVWNFLPKERIDSLRSIQSKQ